jgi:DNA-directed RNA polymerase subunit RPC12/RpoP
VVFEQAAEELLITDEAEIERAKAGPDIHCAYCGARNPATVETCSQCGADLAKGEARASGEVLGAHRDKPAKRVPCPSCGSLNPATALECANCGASMARPEPEPMAHRQPARTQKNYCGIIAVVAIAAVVVLVIIFFVLSARTTDVVGRVEDVSWSRSVAVEALGPVTYQSWRDEVPAGAVLGHCTDKVHHIQDRPAPSSDAVCGTPYTVDTGSGYGEVVQECRYHVYEDWCQYTVQEWRVVDTVTLEGKDLKPRWPVLHLGPDQREGGRQERYKCVFDADGDAFTYDTGDAPTFALCKIGTRWVLKVNTFNSVMGLEPAE